MGQSSLQSIPGWCSWPYPYVTISAAQARKSKHENILLRLIDFLFNPADSGGGGGEEAAGIFPVKRAPWRGKPVIWTHGNVIIIIIIKSAPLDSTIVGFFFRTEQQRTKNLGICEAPKDSSGVYSKKGDKKALFEGAFELRQRSHSVVT